MSKSVWEMVVPVIPTGHAPSMNFINDLRGACVEASIYADGTVFDLQDGCLLFLVTDEDWFPEWFLPIAAWMEVEYPGETWIRFSMDGDIIEELPQYDW